METLTAIHWQTVSIPIQRLLKIFGARECIQPFYLAGGTGLAMQLGHRRSVDLDFFSATDEVSEVTRQRIVAALADAQPQVLEAGMGSLYLLIAGVRVSFHAYAYPLVDELRQVDGVPVAGINDIGMMKLDALINRGSRKDFYDLYTIHQHIPLGQLLERGREKYPMVRDFGLLAVESMLIFGNADRDRQPDLLVDLSWPEAKAFFTHQAKALGEKWLTSDDGHITQPDT